MALDGMRECVRDKRRKRVRERGEIRLRCKRKDDCETRIKLKGCEINRAFI